MANHISSEIWPVLLVRLMLVFVLPLSGLACKPGDLVFDQQRVRASTQEWCRANGIAINDLKSYARSTNGRLQFQSLFQLAALETTRVTIADPVDRTSGSTYGITWSLGSPEKPWFTKFGGIPYRSSDSEWPKGSDGSRLRFLVQINFSCDPLLCEKMNCDLLQIFVKDVATNQFDTPLGKDTDLALQRIRVREVERPCAKLPDGVEAYREISGNYVTSALFNDREMLLSKRWSRVGTSVYVLEPSEHQPIGVPIALLASVDVFDKWMFDNQTTLDWTPDKEKTLPQSKADMYRNAISIGDGDSIIIYYDNTKDELRCELVF